MLLKNTKKYIKEKFLKYKNDRLWTYLWAKKYFSVDWQYIVEKNIIYEITKEKKRFNKNELIENFWVDKWNNISKKIDEWTFNNYYFIDYKLIWDENEINKTKEKIFNWLYKEGLFIISFFSNSEKPKIKINELFEYKEWIKLKSEILWNNNFLFYWSPSFLLNEIIYKKLEEKNITKNYNYSIKLDKNAISFLINSLKDFFTYKLETGVIIKKRLVNKNDENNLLLSFFNIEENVVFNWNEIIKTFNKDSNLEKIHDKCSYYWTAPRWYRKKENKKFKNDNKNNLIKNIKNWNLDLISTINYKKNASRYF